MSNKKRKSVFRILFFRIFVAVLLINIVLAFFSIREEIKSEKQYREARKEAIRGEISNINYLLSSSLKTIEKVLYYSQEDVCRKLLELYETTDLRNVNLKEQLVLFGLDSINHDFYIIENGIVVNTTYPGDLQLNLYDFGEEFVNQLKRVLKTGEFTQDRIALVNSIKRFRSYSYLATEDKRYIIEIGSYSKAADDLLNAFNKRTQDVVNSYDDIISVNSWFDRDYPRSLFKDSFENDDLNNIVRRSLETKSNQQIEINKNGQSLLIEAIYITEESLTKERVITIVTDITDQNAFIYSIIKEQIIYTLIFLVVLMSIIFLVTHGLKKTVRNLVSAMTEIAGGAYKKRVEKTGNNEFTTLSEQFNQMVEKVESSYNTLNQQKEEIQSQRDLAAQQRDLISEQKQEITDSIQYAYRIQTAAIPSEEQLKELVSDHFILYLPRDIVSGDFYWIGKQNEKIIVIAADCTGHGVPGAFMSMLGIAFLNEIVNKENITSPADILNKLRQDIIKALKQSGKEGEQKDGMDVAAITIDPVNNKLEFAGANNPLYLVRNNELLEKKGDKMPVAIHVEMNEYENHIVDIQKNDNIYIFSDGFPDQFGGPKGKKFKYKPFKELLSSISKTPMNEQHKTLKKTFDDWKGDNEQLDDVLVIGIKI